MLRGEVGGGIVRQIVTGRRGSRRSEVIGRIVRTNRAA